MKHISALGALLIAGALGACGNGSDAPADTSETKPVKEKAVRQAEKPDWQASIAGLQGLADEDFSMDEGQEADLTGINEALPDLVSVSWDEKTFDEESGATVFSGLTVTVASDPEFGLTAEDAEIWGLNSDLIAARMRGERLEEEGLAFNRFKARNVSYFGVAGAMNTVFEQLEEKIGDGSDELDNVGVDTFETTISEMVITNTSLRPYELEKAPDTFFADLGFSGEDMSEEDLADQEAALKVIRLAQQVVAVARSLSTEEAAIYDTSVRFAMHQPEVNQSIKVSWGFYGYEDLNGFDLGRAVIVDSLQSQAIEMSDETGELAEAGFEDFGYEQVETTAFTSYEDVEFDKLAGFLVRSEFPSMEERDLLSLGRWQMRDYAVKLNDGDIFKVDRIDLDADSFAWFIPENIGLEMSGAELDAEAVGEVALAFIPEDAVGTAETLETVPEEDGAAGEEGPSQETSGEEVLDNLRIAVGKLDEHGLSTIPFNISGNWNWNAESGETSMSLDMTSEGFGDGAASADVRLPGYSAVQQAYEAEDREAAFQQAFEDAFAFGGARLYEADDGGYDKLFAYVSDIAKQYPEEGWGAMLGNMDPAQIRGFIANMIRSAKQAAAQEFPPAAGWMESIAAYYQTSGGSLELLSDPPEPVTVEYFETFGPDPDPEQFVEKLGLSVTHTPE